MCDVFGDASGVVVADVVKLSSFFEDMVRYVLFNVRVIVRRRTLTTDQTKLKE